MMRTDQHSKPTRRPHANRPTVTITVVALILAGFVWPAGSLSLAQSDPSIEKQSPIPDKPAGHSRPASPNEPALHDGDTVVFLGDELTDVTTPINSNQYPVLVETFFTVRYPHLRIRWVNAGWADDTAARALLRLDRDVLAWRPTVVVVCLGLNDPEYLPFDKQKLAAFRRDMLTIVKRCQQAGARVWLLSPPAVQDDKEVKTFIRRQGKPAAVDLAAIGYNQTMKRYAKAMAEIAQNTQSGFADWYSRCSSALQHRQRNNLHSALSRDGRIPTPQGDALGAVTLLRAWGAKPIEVLIGLDWKKGTAVVTTHAGDPTPRSIPVDITENGKRTLQINGLPLPWPMASGQGEILTASSEAADMCTFLFRMTRPPERGIVLVQQTSDGGSTKPLTISANQLRAGFNLAATNPLQSNQAVTKLFRLIGTKNYYRYGTWRKLQLSPPKEPELAEAHRQLVAAWATYVRGCEEIIFNCPKAFDAKMILTESTRTEQLLTRPPATKRTPSQDPVPKRNPSGQAPATQPQKQ